MVSSIRVEKDRFGERELPASALYGIQTLRSLDNLSFSTKRLSDYPELVTSLAMVKKACARTNGRTGELATSLSTAIEEACDSIAGGDFLDQFPVDMLHGGGSIAFNMNMNEVISNVANRQLGGEVGDYAPVEPKSHVNMSQSTADVCATSFRLALRGLFDRCREELQNLFECLTAKANELESVTTLARTCLQDAMPVSMGALFGGYASALGRRIACLDSTIELLDSVSLGGTVIGTGSGASPQYRLLVVDVLSEVIGRPLRSRENLCDAAQNMDDMADLSSQIEHVGQLLLKIARDLRLLSSGPKAGFAELKLPRVQEGSSFFHEKNNPVVPETIISCCIQLSGCNRAVQAAAENAELYLNVFESVAAVNLMDELRMLKEAASLFRRNCIADLEADSERCQTYVKEYS